MLKTIFPPLLLLLAMGTAFAAQHSDQAATAALPAQTPSANPDKPANPDKESTSQSASTPQPNSDKLDDYRYCLELKTNREIANCRYKK